MNKIKVLCDVMNQVSYGMPSKNESIFRNLAKGLEASIKLYGLYDNHKKHSSISDYLANDSQFVFSVLNDAACLPFIKNNGYFYRTHDAKSRDYMMEIVGAGNFLLRSEENSTDISMHKSPWFHKKFNYSFLGDLIYEKYGLKIAIEKDYKKVMIANDRYEYSYQNSCFKFKELYSQDKILDNEITKRANELLKTDGTYLFYGAAGTGKSAFIFSSNFLTKRCIRINAKDFFIYGFSDSYKEMLQILNPDVLVIEELDKIDLNAHLGDLLLKLEEVRCENKKIIITANKILNFDASLIRPKRIDYILEFTPPNLEEIQQMVDFYSQSKNIEEKEKFSKLMFENQFTHAYVVDLAKKLNNNFEDVSKYVEFLKKIKK
ncbi:MAG: ATP-binding protein [Chitinophagales bacterium]|nr:ATP-binding protein [Chitinophagales bacterium]